MKDKNPLRYGKPQDSGDWIFKLQCIRTVLDHSVKYFSPGSPDYLNEKYAPAPLDFMDGLRHVEDLIEVAQHATDVSINCTLCSPRHSKG